MSRRLLILVLTLSFLLTLAVLPSTNVPVASADTFNYFCTGGEQTFVVPAGVTSINVAAVGAPGGGAPGSASGRAARQRATGRLVAPQDASIGGNRGLGNGVQADMTVTPGQTLYVNVGCNGGTPDPAGSVGGAGGVSLYRNVAADGEVEFVRFVG